eukprot:CAMPEP_0113306466 /NCGR_PEP_ID=MMETSP0010_2-20120614/5704_1 /TAXON_ID=216773 ORGANISM="Corethron hystrix, Strain 308" /NCGR_SAMPLE_ID=MMETSP0010_2 /ASSEMBLY_ACC=CAM_ASM_000155 /LENGTH=556 /DNA_ID=CAMNT_0000161135 /DNA_START=362 /DNA_END=2032 /DNA_ORIENTATION=- /assembly_acc=CAM_ASM_000155
MKVEESGPQSQITRERFLPKRPTTLDSITLVAAAVNMDDSEVFPPQVAAALNAVPNVQMLSQQMSGIRIPHANDVLCGRGGGTNNHSGNERFRLLVASKKRQYLQSSKRDKPTVSKEIVAEIRTLNPSGRFLTKNNKTGLWDDIGDKKAREKTSQALREGAPEIRDKIMEDLGKSNLPVNAVMSGAVTKGRRKRVTRRGNASEEPNAKKKAPSRSSRSTSSVKNNASSKGTNVSTPVVSAATKKGQLRGAVPLSRILEKTAPKFRKTKIPLPLSSTAQYAMAVQKVGLREGNTSIDEPDDTLDCSRLFGGGNVITSQVAASSSVPLDDPLGDCQNLSHTEKKDDLLREASVYQDAALMGYSPMEFEQVLRTASPSDPLLPTNPIPPISTVSAALRKTPSYLSSNNFGSFSTLSRYNSLALPDITAGQDRGVSFSNIFNDEESIINSDPCTTDKTDVPSPKFTKTPEPIEKPPQIPSSRVEQFSSPKQNDGIKPNSRPLQCSESASEIAEVKSPAIDIVSMEDPPRPVILSDTAASANVPLSSVVLVKNQSSDESSV